MAEAPDLLRRVHEYAVAAFEFDERLPAASKGRSAGEQFYRASSSTESNYRAAKRGRSTAEFIAKLGVVVEESTKLLVGWSTCATGRSHTILTCCWKQNNCAESSAPPSERPAAING
jgi:hypothetical protein